MQSAEQFVRIEGKDVDMTWRYTGYCKAERETALEFSIDSVKGTLTLAGDFSTQGKTPRNFALDPTGKFLLAANQESNNIVVFRINQSTGALTATGQVAPVPAPVDIVFVPAK